MKPKGKDIFERREYIKKLLYKRKHEQEVAGFSKYFPILACHDIYY